MPFETGPKEQFERKAYFAARAWLQDLRKAIVFLTRIPVPGLSDSDDVKLNNEDENESEKFPIITPMGRSVRVFPVVGALVGIFGGIVFAFTMVIGLPTLVASVIAIAFMVFVTGALHEDGLADMVDGLGGGKNRKQKLSIMRDSRIGAYGVIALVLVLGAKVGALTELENIGVVICALICASAFSRAVMPAMMRWMPAAQNDGLASNAGKPPADAVWMGFAIAVLFCVCLLTWSGIVALIISSCSAFVVGFLARRQIGGHTGDILGATQQTSELIFLLTLAAIR